MDMATDAPLLMADAAIELFLAVHPDDYPRIVDTQFVPRRTYAATRKTYIGLRENRDDAVDRAMRLFDKGDPVEQGTVHLLRIQFSYKGFAQYATKVLGADEAFAPILYKITYQPGGRDWGAWAFHGDLPLQESAEDGQVLIASEWTV